MNEPQMAEMGRDVVSLDVCEDIRQGREPFSKIMNAASGLADGQQLRLIAPFEPVPLFHVLVRQGFSHAARQMDDGNWEIVFSRNRAENQAAGDDAAIAKNSVSQTNARAGELLEVNARGLEPPQPMVTILEALATLPAGAQLRAWTDRRPIHLLARLEERGFIGETSEENGSFVTHIRRS